MTTMSCSWVERFEIFSMVSKCKKPGMCLARYAHSPRTITSSNSSLRSSFRFNSSRLIRSISRPFTNSFMIASITSSHDFDAARSSAALRDVARFYVLHVVGQDPLAESKDRKDPLIRYGVEDVATFAPGMHVAAPGQAPQVVRNPRLGAPMASTSSPTLISPRRESSMRTESLMVLAKPSRGFARSCTWRLSRPTGHPRVVVLRCARCACRTPFAYLATRTSILRPRCDLASRWLRRCPRRPARTPCVRRSPEGA